MPLSLLPVCCEITHGTRPCHASRSGVVFLSGFGKLTFSDGEIYIGEFFKDKKHGQGMSISPAKDKEFSRWRYGKKNQDLKLYLFKNNSYF